MFGLKRFVTSIGQKAESVVKKGVKAVGDESQRISAAAHSVGDIAGKVGSVATTIGAGAAMIGLEPIAAGALAVGGLAKGVQAGAGAIEGASKTAQVGSRGLSTGIRGIDAMRRGDIGGAVKNVKSAAADARNVRKQVQRLRK